MTEASRLAADLERAIGAGDAATVARLVVDATERERRAASQSVGLREGVFESEALEGIRSLACLGCDTPAEVADMPFHFLQAIDMVEPALIAAVVRARGDAFVADLVRRLVKPREPALVSWQLLRALTRAGVIERPDGDWWAHYVPWGVVPTGAEWDGVQAAYLGLIRDPGILEEEL